MIIHKVETTESIVTCCQVPIAGQGVDFLTTLSWPKATCSECLKHRPASQEWMTQKDAFKEADQEDQ